VFATPIRVGQLPSAAKRVLERWMHFRDEIDGPGRYPTSVASRQVAVVGNEDVWSLASR
jgi:multimeric flavodoxin WrbA